MSELVVKNYGFVGTSCTYKTSLFEFYRHKYEGDTTVAFVPEAARLFFSKVSNVDRFSEPIQRRVQGLTRVLESKEQRDDVAIVYCDRTRYDAPSYLRALGNVAGAQRLVERVSLWTPRYDAIFLLDPEGIAYETDEQRTETPEEREQFHQGFLSLFAEHNIPYHLVGGTFEERVEQIDAVTGALTP